MTEKKRHKQVLEKHKKSSRTEKVFRKIREIMISE